MTRIALALALLGLCACGDDGASIVADASAQDALVVPDTGGADTGPVDSGVACNERVLASFAIPTPGATRYAIGAAITDEITGLVWERDPVDTPRTLAEAHAYCASLGEGWRVPARVELVTILDASRTPSVAPELAALDEYHWTASHPACRDERAYSIYFGQGETVIADATRAGAVVRCVRGERGPTGFALEDGYVRDLGTGLRWDRAPSAPMTHDAAITHCESRACRLPTLNELQTIADESRTAPALDLAYFDPAPAPEWTHTLRDFGEILAWTVDFTDAQTHLEPLTRPFATRCLCP